jgi:adenylylsulfate kinase
MGEVEITWHDQSVSRTDRERLNGHRGCVLWFTGLSGCGKSTVANALDHRLHQRGAHTVLLDGDNVRHGLNASPQILADQFDEAYAQRFGLGFGATDRTENIRRIAAVAGLFSQAGVITLTAFVSPYRADRNAARKQIVTAGQAGDFCEVFVDTPLEVCESRDPKGLYKKARAGEIKNFTGIDDPYESPENAEVVLAGDRHSPDELAAQIEQYLESVGILGKSPA